MDGEAWLERAEKLLERRELEAARAAFAQAVALGIETYRCSGGLWMLAMLRGDFEVAWRESDVIRARGGNDPHRFWLGEDLRGKQVIVRCLHGFGDTVQMLRYAPLLRTVAASVVWETQPRMVELAPYFGGVEQVVTWGQEAPAWEVQVEAMELPYLMRTHLSDLPIATTYLKLPETVTNNTAHAMGKRKLPRVGLVWAGGEWNVSRWIPFAVMARLLELEGIEFWNLQGGIAAEAARETPMRDATAICGEGQLMLAAAIAHLDLVITVDTLAAHLAGAMGKPVWVMLQHAVDWRWMLEREDSPWYPSMRLFRQRHEGDWVEVIDAVLGALREFAGC